MTEKRFKSQMTSDYNFSDIFDGKEWIGSCHVDCADDFVNKLNSLADENQRLRELLEESIGVSQVEIDEELRRMKNE